MKREDIVGIKLECIGTDEHCENQFTIGKVYEIVDVGRPNLKIIAEDGFNWTVFHNNYENINHMVESLSRKTTGQFKLYEKENPKMEKKMTKTELEGKFVRCTWKRSTNHYNVGDLLEIKNKLIVSQDGNDTLFSWYENLEEEFTIAELNRVLETSYDTTVKFEYVGDYPQSPNKVKSDEVKPDKKSKASEIKVPVKVKVDMLFDPPVIEETNDEVFIFSGRSTIYINKEFGIYGISTVNSKELSSYDRETGRAISYYRAFKSMDKK